MKQTSATSLDVELQAQHAADWHALHIFLSEPTLSNRFLVEWLAPQARQQLLAGHARNWFFVRYWEGGPHLRVRLKGMPAAQREVWHAAVQQALTPYLNPEPVARETYYGAHGFDGAPIDLTTLPWHAEGSVIEQPYEPEWQRYGGSQAMAVHEVLFDLSSTLAAALVRTSLTDPMRRMALSASVMPEFALAWRADAATLADFFDTYAAYWANYSQATRRFAEQLGSTASAPPAAAQVQALAEQVQAAAGGIDTQARAPHVLLRQGLREAVQQLGAAHAHGLLRQPLDGRTVESPGAYAMAVQSMLSSQLHMFNNRMGLVPAQEVVLAKGISRTARALLGQAAPHTVLQ
jgi:thiopeptide-type bacteriocin biosynthesis protein